MNKRRDELTRALTYPLDLSKLEEVDFFLNNFENILADIKLLAHDGRYLQADSILSILEENLTKYLLGDDRLEQLKYCRY